MKGNPRGGAFLALLVLSFQKVAAQQGLSPLCDRCRCTGEDNRTDINCTNGNVSSILYKNTTWYDDKNASFAIIGINLQYNNLKELNTPFVTSELMVLDLSNNSLRNISDGVFTNLQKMELLILSDNEIEYLNPDVFKGYYRADTYYPLQALRKLILSNNKLHTLHQDLFMHTTKIETLVLSGNPFKVLDYHTVMAIGSLPYLVELDLSRTELSGLPDHFLHTPKHLKILNLSGNLFESVPKTLMDAQNLEVLHFDGNPFRNFTHKIGFPHMKSLKKLFFCNMPELLEVGSHTFGSLIGLKELHICNNPKLRAIHPSALNRKEHHGVNVLPNFLKIYFENNNLTHLDRHLLHWRELHDFDLSGNPWACDCSNHWLIYNLSSLVVVYENGENYNNKPRIHHPNRFTCASPEHLKQMKIFDVSSNKTMVRCPKPSPASKAHSYVLASVVSGLVVILCAAGVMVYLYKKNHISYAKLNNYTYRFRRNQNDAT